MLTPKKCGDCEGEETASHKSGLKTFCAPKNLEENLWADGRKSAKGTNYKPKIRYFVSLTKKDKDDVWFKFYFWQVWSALLWAASSKPLQMLPFDPLCLKSLSHFSLKQRMKDLFSVIELMSYHQAVWTEQNRCWYFTNFQIDVFMKIVQGRGRRNRRRI